MQRHHIPTAAYAVATSEQQALESIDLFHLPLVIKADGLASGKGVIVCETRREAGEAIAGLFSGKNSVGAQSSIVIEEFLTRRRGLLSPPHGWKACNAAGSRAGPQADRRGR